MEATASCGFDDTVANFAVHGSIATQCCYRSKTFRMASNIAFCFEKNEHKF